jgi:hypothetical protein
MTDTNLNGTPAHAALDLDELAELAKLTALNKQRINSLTVEEHPAPSVSPFDQQAHELMLKGIDQVVSDWVRELEHVRHNSKQVEQLVMERAAKVKADITMLYILGKAALSEAKRGDDVNAKLADELDKLTEDRVA